MSTTRYNESRPVGAIVGDVLNNIGCLERFQEAKAIEKWVEIAGPDIASITSRVFVHKGVLYVEVTNSVWRQELHMNREGWCNRLNRKLSKPMLRKIVFR